MTGVPRKRKSSAEVADRESTQHDGVITTRTPFHELAVALYGVRYSKLTSQLLEVEVSLVQDWAEGTLPVPDAVMRRFEAICEEKALRMTRAILAQRRIMQ